MRLTIYGIVLILGILFTGCTGVIKNGIAEKNRDTLMLLEVGMTKQEVLKKFGKSNSSEFRNPFKREVKSLSNGSVQEALFFITDVIPDGKNTDEELTPVMLIDNKVVGWGWSFYRESDNNINVNIHN